MALLRRLLARLDGFQQRHIWLSFPMGVVRKMTDDQGGSLAALVSHYGFLSVFPLILVFSAVLGFVLGSDPSLKMHVIKNTEESFPALSGYISNSIRGSNVALGIGTFVALWAGLGVTRATERAMNAIWDIPLSKRPNLWWSRLRGLLMLVILGVTFLVSTGLASLQQTGGVLSVPAAVLSTVGPLVLNLALYLLAFQVLTNRHLPWRSLVPGALVGAVGWTALQSLGALYTRHELAHASQLYGALAGVIGLLAWIYLGALLTLYAAEVNVVLAYRLWPRSLGRVPATEADRRALVRQAQEYERTAGEIITVSFKEAGDDTTETAGEQRLSTLALAVHENVSRLVVHLRTFDKYHQQLDGCTDESERLRLNEHLRAEADEAAGSLAELAEEESVLVEAVMRRLR